MHVLRNIEKALLKSMRRSAVVVLRGVRGTGKTTLLHRLLPDYDYVSLADIRTLRQAFAEPASFFKSRKLPLIVDDIQYAPQLLHTVKEVVDQDGGKGVIVLAGLPSPELLNAGKLLAGRVSILELSSLSQREFSESVTNRPFIPGKYEMRGQPSPAADVWQRIVRGGMPKLASDTALTPECFYRDYVRSYLERDVRNMLNVKDLLGFGTFMVTLAKRAAQVLVCHEVARDCALSTDTVRRWLSVLCATGLIKLLPCYSATLRSGKRNAPVLYFMDCGLICYLTGWQPPEQAASSAMSRALYENLVISEIAKAYLNAGKDLKSLYYYLPRGQSEYTLLIENRRLLHPVAINQSVAPDKRWLKHFSALTRAMPEVGEGAVVCLCDELTSLSSEIKAVTVGYL